MKLNELLAKLHQLQSENRELADITKSRSEEVKNAKMSLIEFEDRRNNHYKRKNSGISKDDLYFP